MTQIIRQTSAPDQVVLQAISDYLHAKHGKADIDLQNNSVALRKKVLWQKQEAVFTVENGTLTATGNCQDSDGVCRKTVDHLAELLDDHGWAEATQGTQSLHKDSRARSLVLAELLPGEKLVSAISGFQDNKQIVVAATQQRILLVAKEILGMDGGSQTIPLDKIGGISEESGMVFGGVRISASGAEIKIEKVIKNEVKDFVSAVRRIGAEPSSAAAAAPAPETPSNLGELKSLAELHAAGVLTDEEFAAAKARILGI